MNGVLTIAGRDLRSLFKSPLIYVVGGLCATLWTLVFLVSLSSFLDRGRMGMFQGGSSVYENVFKAHISMVNFVMILATAALTMRLIAEEKRNRTYDLLLTAPVTATQIVLGKLLAGIVAAWSLVLLSAVCPVSVRAFGEIEWGPLIGAYAGLLFVVAAYVGLGLFASSMTESPVLSVVVSLVLSCAVWFVGAGAESDNQLVAKTFEHLSIGTHFMAFLKGAVGTSNFIYFASVVFLCAFLAQRVVESSRWR